MGAALSHLPCVGRRDGESDPQKITDQHAERVAEAGFACKSICTEPGCSIFDVNLSDEGPEMQENLKKYYSFCRDASDLSCTLSCFSSWNQKKKTNGYAKLIPAVPQSTEDNIRVFFFDDNIEWQGKATDPGIVNLRDIATGSFVDFGEGANGFSRGHVGAHTVIHHSTEYKNVLVQANILDAMEDENYFVDIIKKYLEPDEKAIIFMDVNSTIISVDSVSSKDTGQVVLGTIFEFINLQPREPFEFDWDGCPPVKVGKVMHLKKLAKEVFKNDKAMYEKFFTHENCMKMLSLLVDRADLKWSLRDDAFSIDDFEMQYNRYLVSLTGATDEDGIVRSWFTCSDYCKKNGYCTMLNTFGIDGRKVILKTVVDERHVLQFSSSFAKWDARDKEGLENIYGEMSVK